MARGVSRVQQGGWHEQWAPLAVRCHSSEPFPPLRFLVHLPSLVLLSFLNGTLLGGSKEVRPSFFRRKACHGRTQSLILLWVWYSLHILNESHTFTSTHLSREVNWTSLGGSWGFLAPVACIRDQSQHGTDQEEAQIHIGCTKKLQGGKCTRCTCLF